MKTNPYQKHKRGYKRKTPYNKSTKRKFQNSKIAIYKNDCTLILPNTKIIPRNSIDAVVTDPPYGIKFFNKKWDYNIPSVKTFKKILKVLKPGGTLVCFASPRTQHRMAINIEDAGFELRDCLMWLFGSGFPKSQEINSLIKKQFKKNEKTDSYVQELNQLTKTFEGYRTHALKPAYEPIIIAMKPLEGNYAENAIKYQISGLNIDECRLEDKGKKWEKPRGGIWKTDKEAKSILVDNTLGRFPSNIIYEDNDEVRNALIQSIDDSMNIKDKNKDFITRIFYCAKVKGKSKEENSHPTIKPVSLMRYICKLVKSPSQCTILDPFMGSGTTGLACLQENIKFIGIEKEQEYYDIAKKRIIEEYEKTESAQANKEFVMNKL